MVGAKFQQRYFVTLFKLLLLLITILSIPATSQAFNSSYTPQNNNIYKVVPAGVDFGNVLVGLDGIATIRISVIANIDGARFTIDKPVITVGDPVFFIARNLDRTILSMSETATFDVGFRPDSANTFSGVVRIDTNFGSTAVNLTGKGITVQSSFQVTPTSINYGNVGVGQNATQSVTIKNTGNVPLPISSVMVTSGASSGFTISRLPDTSLPINQSSTFDISFAPTSASKVTGVVTVTTGAGTATISLNGTGTSGPALQVPLTLDFGTISLGQSSILRLPVTNKGGQSLTVSSVTLSGDTSSNFAITKQLTSSVLAPNVTDNLEITYKASTGGLASGAVMILSDGGSAIVNLTANGSDQTPPTVQVNSLNNGDALIAGQPVTIQFQGSDNDQVSGFTVSYSTDGGATFPNNIARVGGNVTQVVWNVPDGLTTNQGVVQVTARDRAGNMASAQSGKFVVQQPLGPGPRLKVVISIAPPPAGQIAPPTITNLTATPINSATANNAIIKLNPNADSSTQLLGFNIYRVPQPPDGQPLPPPEQIVNNASNLVGSIPADQNQFTDTVTASKSSTGNFAYSVTAFFGNGMMSSGSQPVGTNLPVIKNPVFKSGTIFINAAGSFIQNGAQLVINDTESYNINFDDSGTQLTVSKKAASNPSGLKIKKVIKKKSTVKLVIINPDSTTSVPVMFTR